jgi:hypothetical protein
MTGVLRCRIDREIDEEIDEEAGAANQQRTYCGIKAIPRFDGALHGTNNTASSFPAPDSVLASTHLKY